MSQIESETLDFWDQICVEISVVYIFLSFFFGWGVLSETSNDLLCGVNILQHQPAPSNTHLIDPRRATKKRVHHAVGTIDIGTIPSEPTSECGLGT